MASNRSRTVIFPAARWRATRSVPPISAANARRWCSSSTSGIQLIVGSSPIVASSPIVVSSPSSRSSLCPVTDQPVGARFFPMAPPAPQPAGRPGQPTTGNPRRADRRQAWTYVHWPAGIAARGQLRHQFCDITDVPPTVHELAGRPEPTTVNGVILNQGGITGSWAFYLHDGRPTYHNDGDGLGRAAPSPSTSTATR